MDRKLYFYVLYYLYQAMTESDFLNGPGEWFYSIIWFVYIRGLRGGKDCLNPVFI